MADTRKRVSLSTHLKDIEEWVGEEKSDRWIADALGTSASSVQSFRSRHSIYRRREERTTHAAGPHSVFEGALDHGDREGWGLWLDPAIAGDPIWKGHWSNVESVVVKVSADAIVLEPYGANRESAVEERGSAGSSGAKQRRRRAGLPAMEKTAEEEGEAPIRERGRVKWFDKEKGYGFLIGPLGEEVFVHRSEVEPEQSVLEPGEEVDYEPATSKRGELARKVKREAFARRSLPQQKASGKE